MPTPSKPQLIGPFQQILTMANLPSAGFLSDEQLEIITDGGVLVKEGKIVEMLDRERFQHYLKARFTEEGEQIDVHQVPIPSVLLPGFIDTHTHICYAGTRALDYASRLAGESYLEIAKRGGGILDTVRRTREASQDDLERNLMQRAQTQLRHGITTCEVKSGYGLSVEAELKMLRAIHSVDAMGHDLFPKAPALPRLVPTCLAAHVCPPEFETPQDYLQHLTQELLPVVASEKLSRRVDIFIEEGAFEGAMALDYLNAAKEMGFELTVHADQFSKGGSAIAAQVGAISADHLEVSDEESIAALKEGNVIATVLPGASMGLGMSFSPARKLLDAGLSLVIASDWNPGSAPMGDLLTQAAVLGAYEKLTLTETLAALTCRAAQALQLTDRGQLKANSLADMIAFPCDDFREILYRQGSLKPHFVWKSGRLV